MSSFGTVAALRAQRAGYIRRPREAGGRACVNTVSKSSNIELPTLFKGPRGSAARAKVHEQPPAPCVGRSVFGAKLGLLGPSSAS